MNLSIVFCILAVVIACTVSKTIASESCDIIQFTEHKNVNFQCLSRMTDKQTNKTSCTVSCNGEFETRPADEYTCVSTPDNPNGIWAPDAVPRCLRKDCDIMQFTKGKNVAFKCLRGIYDNQILCTFSCNGEFESQPADQYKCAPTPEHPGGVWEPDVAPQCLRKDCDIVQFTKGKNVAFQCLRGINDNQTSCTFSCNGEFEFHPADEYKCTSTAVHPDGIWMPDSVPKCLRKDCIFNEMAKDKNVDWMCYRKEFNIQTFCTTYCINETTKEDEYTCAATEEYPMGIWTPDVVPYCARTYEDFELCDIPPFAKRHYNIGWECIQHNYTARTCNPYCKFTGKYLIPREYKCKVIKGIRGGKWHPEVDPGCAEVMEECKMAMFTTEENLGWHCEQKTYDAMSCTPYCKVEGDYLSQPGVYTCKVTAGKTGGEWYPEVPPTCLKASAYELCDILEFAKDAHNIVWSCKQRNTDMTCNPHCNISDGIEPAMEKYTCKVSRGVPGGVWYPKYLPVCIRE